MALLTQGSILAALQLAGAAYPQSKTLPKVFQAVSQAVDAWIHVPFNVVLVGATAGTAGTGTVTGLLFFVPAGQFQAAFAAAGLVGSFSPQTAQVFETGLGTALQAAQYQGTSAGVSAGTDLTKILSANTGTLLPILQGQLIAAGISGQTMPKLAQAVATGLGTLLLTGTGVGAVAPIAAAPGAAAGTSTSFFL